MNGNNIIVRFVDAKIYQISVINVVYGRNRVLGELYIIG